MKCFEIKLVREFTCRIAAPSTDKLRDALAEAANEIDDWDPPPWEVSIHDPEEKVKNLNDFDRLPPLVKPDMVVSDKGTIVNALDTPDLLAALVETRAALGRKLAEEKYQLKLPGVD
jgi:hypothetical protein